MKNTVNSRLQSVRFAEPQRYKNLAVLPLLAPAEGTFPYRTLGEALAAGELIITEVSAAGSVPEALVVNRGSQPVLLVDGEELAGAKQNRVLNTSILLREVSETKIPVTCTEQGRWSYASEMFAESGNVLAYKSRSRKARSVHGSLEAAAGHQSDQHEVWRSLEELQLKAGAASATASMSYVFKAWEEDLRKCDAIFQLVPQQVGLIAFLNGQPAGVDLVSRRSAYAKLHPKLVRSYTLEGLVDAPKPGGQDPKQEAPAPDALASRGRRFLEEIAAAEEREFPSVGYGTDHRFRGPALAGTALVHADEVIHAAFFRLDGSESPERMASYHSRRRRFAE